MAKSKTIQKAGTLFNKVKYWAVYIGVGFIGLFYFLKFILPPSKEYLSGIFVGFVTIGFYVIIWVLFDIHKQVKEKPDKRVILQTGWDAFPKLIELIKGPKKNRQNVKIFALTLNTVWNNLKSFLQSGEYTNIDIKLLQVDLELEGLESIHSGWKEEAERNWQEINNYIRDNSDALTRMRISIQVKRYKHGPCIHGYMVNDKNLFFSHCIWKVGTGERVELVGDPSFYEHFDNREDEKQRPYFELFDNWFNHFFCDKKEKEVKSN